MGLCRRLGNPDEAYGSEVNASCHQQAGCVGNDNHQHKQVLGALNEYPRRRHSEPENVGGSTARQVLLCFSMDHICTGSCLAVDLSTISMSCIPMMDGCAPVKVRP